MKTPASSASSASPASHFRNAPALLAIAACLLIPLTPAPFAPRASAADLTFSGGDLTLVTGSSKAAGDRVLINSVDSGQFVLSNTTIAPYMPAGWNPVYTFTGSVTTIKAVSNIKSANDGITFVSQFGPGNWTMITMTASAQRFFAFTGEPVDFSVNLQNLILTGARYTSDSSVFKLTAGTGLAANTLHLNGDFIVTNNWASGAGGVGQLDGMSVMFGGADIFDSNRAGTDPTTGLINSTNGGGAFRFNVASGTLTFAGPATFLNNRSGGSAGAIMLTTGVNQTLLFNATAIFSNNAAGYNAPGAPSPGNYNQNGGAIQFNGTGTQTLIFSNTAIFLSNTASGYAGAINTNQAASTLDFRFQRDALFIGNIATGTGSSSGGALYLNGALGTVSFQRTALFLSNTGAGLPGYNVGSGGAIAINGAGDTSSANIVEILNGGTFANNYAQLHGGALWTGNAGPYRILLQTGTLATSPLVFANNTASTGQGGAIYFSGSAGSTLTLSAQNADILFTANKASGSPNDIYFNTTTALAQQLTLDAAPGRAITFTDGIANNLTNGGLVTILKTGPGAVNFATTNSPIAASTTIAAGTFNLNNATYGATGTGNFTILSGATLTAAGDSAVLADQINLNAASTIRVTNNASLNLAANTITQSAPGSILAGNGAINASGLPLAASEILIGDTARATAQKLTIAAALDLSTATLHYGIFTGTADTLAITGPATLAYASTTFDYSDFANGTYRLLTSTAPLTLLNTGAFNTTLNGAPLTNPRLTVAYTVAATTIDATMTKLSAARTWAGANGAAWDATGVTKNWQESPDQAFLNGDAVAFNAAAGGTVAVAPTGVIASAMLVNSAGNYTFTGGPITTDSTSWLSSTPPATVDGKLTKTGAGTLTLATTGTNNFIQGITINAGAIAFSNGAQLAGGPVTFAGTGTLRASAGAITLANNIALVTGATAAIDTGTYSMTAAGALSGAGATLAKTGAGTLTLTSAASSAYTGTTAINAGTLLLAKTAALGGALTINSGATLGGSGTAPGAVNALAGSTITLGMPGGTGAQTLTLGALTLNGATLNYTTYGATSDHIKAATATFTGTNTFNFAPTLVTGSYTLIDSTALTGFNSANILTTVNGGPRSARTDISYQTSGGLLYASVLIANRNLVWTGSTNANWDTSGGDANWTNGDIQFQQGDAVTFNSAADSASSANRTITITQPSVLAASVTVTGSGAYTFLGGGIATTTDPALTNIAGATGKFTVALAPGGLVILSNTGANNIVNGIDINSGTLQATARTLGTNTIAVNSTAATLLLDTGPTVNTGTFLGAVTGVGNLNYTGNGTLANAGSINIATINSGTGLATLNLVAGGSLRATTCNLDIGTLQLSGGAMTAATLNLGARGVVSGTGAFNVSNLVNAGQIKVGRAALGATTPFATLTQNGNYTGNNGLITVNTAVNSAGALTATDLFIINGNATGPSRVRVNAEDHIQLITSTTTITTVNGVPSAPVVTNTTTTIYYPGKATGTGPTDGIKVIGVTGADTADFTLDAPVIIGVYDYNLVAGAGGRYLQSVIPDPEIPFGSALPALAVLMGQTSLDSILTRMGETRFDPEHDTGGWWLRNTYNNTQIKLDLFPNTREHTNVFQIGIDRVFKNPAAAETTTRAGAYYTYTAGDGRSNPYTHIDASSNKVPSNRGDIANNANGLGIYILMQKQAWYFAATAKADKYRFELNAPRYSLNKNHFGPQFSYNGTPPPGWNTSDNTSSSAWNLAGVLETGYAKKTTALGAFEPSLMAAFQTYNFGAGSDYSTRGYTYGQVNSLLARAGIRWFGEFKFQNDNALIPWLRLNLGHEFLADYYITVKDAVGTRRRYECDLRGPSFIAEGGLTWRLNTQFALQLNAAWSTANTYRGTTLGAGARYIW